MLGSQRSVPQPPSGTLRLPPNQPKWATQTNSVKLSHTDESNPEAWLYDSPGSGNILKIQSKSDSIMNHILMVPCYFGFSTSPLKHVRNLYEMQHCKTTQITFQQKSFSLGE